jgi:hypothetical protein
VNGGWKWRHGVRRAKLFPSRGFHGAGTGGEGGEGGEVDNGKSWRI